MASLETDHTRIKQAIVATAEIAAVPVAIVAAKKFLEFRKSGRQSEYRTDTESLSSGDSGIIFTSSF